MRGARSSKFAEMEGRQENGVGVSWGQCVGHEETVLGEDSEGIDARAGKHLPVITGCVCL